MSRSYLRDSQVCSIEVEVQTVYVQATTMNFMRYDANCL